MNRPFSRPLEAAPAATAADRRQDFRKKVALVGNIKLLGRARIPCRVLNISASGALLEMTDSIELPQRFRLDIDEDLFEVMCEVRHQAGRRYGVEFASNRQGALARYGS